MPPLYFPSEAQPRTRTVPPVHRGGINALIDAVRSSRGRGQRLSEAARKFSDDRVDHAVPIAAPAAPKS
jgi:hypothetical protein